MTNITEHSIVALRSLMLKKELSVTEVAKAFLAEAKLNSHLNSYLELNEEEVINHAKKLQGLNSEEKDKLPLFGIPIAIKDNILTKGVKTTAASKILENFVPPYDATVITLLKQAGAIIIGKTNLDEFGMGSSNENSYFGPVLNPWDTSRVPGGSSGGSASAVAARTTVAALGTDTGGSIRQPAAFCNLIGLKPTYGRVSRYGIVAYASSLDQVGILARNAEDCHILIKTIGKYDPNDSTSTHTKDISESLENLDLKKITIGLPKEYFIDGIDPSVKNCVIEATKILKSLGVNFKEVSLPHTNVSLATYYIIAPAEASSNLARYDGVRFGHRAKNYTDLNDMYRKTRSEGFGAEVKRRIMIGTYVLSTGYYDAYYKKAQKVRTLIHQDFSNVFNDGCDMILTPTTPTTAFKLGEKTNDPINMYLNDIFTIPLNLAGLPGINIPAGFDDKGLPIGFQLIGKPFAEATLLQTAYKYQQATDWHKQSPKKIKNGL
jgi:aspartyl-tRNA(Asn)/glutamyl-tRNA(Gln) amidotransferase subunit A